MRLAHSLPIALFVSMAALVSACGDEATDDGGTGGSSGTATGGSSTGGTDATGGSGGSGAPTGGTGGSGAPTGGSGGSATGGSGGGGSNDHPTDSSQAGLEAWLDMNTYKTTGMGFRPESTPSTGMSVHGAVLRYFNETIITSKAAGNSGNMHTSGSMAVKDIVTGTTVIGKAAMLRTDTGWIYYCKASEAGRCFTGSVANTATYATTGGGSCACHGSGTINSSAAIPAPL
jgi:hypothetical protein